MNESYAEAGAKRKPSASSYLIKAGMIFLAVFLVLFGGLFIGAFATIIAAVLVCAMFFLFPRLNFEYEYVYVDGQLDFDKIMGNAKRKTVLRLDFEKVEMMAPLGSHTLDGYNHNQVKVKNFTSLNPHAKVYAIVFREGEQANKILFEPSEKMVACIKQKTPRKFTEY